MNKAKKNKKIKEVKKKRRKKYLKSFYIYLLMEKKPFKMNKQFFKYPPRR